VQTSAELRDAITSGTASVLLLDGDTPFVLDISIATEVGPTALLVNRSVVLVAPVGRVAMLDANANATNPRRVLTVVGADVVVELRGVALTGGFSTEWGGGARVEAGAELRLVRSAVHGCVVRTAGMADARGGGVLVNGGARLALLDGSRVSNNTAVSVNGQAQGGGLRISTGGTAVLSASAVDGNTARAEGSGNAYGGGVVTFGTLTARDGTSISSNTAVSVSRYARAGGLAIDTGSTAVLSASAVDGNTARAEGSGVAYGGGVVTAGAITVSDGASILNNTAVSVIGDSEGGGLAISSSGTAVLSASAVNGNTARAEGSGTVYGGGVVTFGTLTARDGASISNNTAVSVNGYSEGGGLKIGPGGTAVLSASAVDGNIARAEGGGSAHGGGVDTDGALTARDGASISSNTAVSVNGYSEGGGLFISAGGTAVLSASAVDGNIARAEGSGSVYGGGVLAFGVLTASDCASISSNTAVSVNGLVLGGGVCGGVGSMSGARGALEFRTIAIVNNTVRAECGARAEGGGLATFGNLTARNATIVGNHAFAANGTCRGGGLFHNGNPAFLYGGVIDGNVMNGATEVGKQAFVGAPLTYVLPAPLGRWLDGVRACNRARCPDGFSTGEADCALQPCDLATHPELEGTQVALALPGPVDGDAFPPRCLPGSYAAGTDPEADQSGRTCSGLCPAGRACFMPGTIAPGGDASALPPAPAGMATSLGDSAGLPCEVGFYSKGGAADRCQQCPFNSTSALGGSSIDACFCEPGFFGAAGACRPCPPGLDCAGGAEPLSVNVLPGSWRPSRRAAEAHVCPGGSLTCAGGLSAADFSVDDPSTCAPGLAGPYCSACTDAHSYLDASSRTCRTCVQSFSFFGAIVGSVVGVAVACLLLAGFMHDPALPFRDRIKGACSNGKRALTTSLLKLGSHPRIVALRAASDSITLLVKGKLLLGFALVMAQMGDVYQIRYPPGFQSLSSTLFSPLRLQLFGWIPGLHLSCLGIHTLQAELLLNSLLPLLVLLLSFAISWGRARSFAPALPFVLRLTYLLYPSVASKGASHSDMHSWDLSVSRARVHVCGRLPDPGCLRLLPSLGRIHEHLLPARRPIRPVPEWVCWRTGAAHGRACRRPLRGRRPRPVRRAPLRLAKGDSRRESDAALHRPLLLA
jgi:hypothetical protein